VVDGVHYVAPFTRIRPGDAIDRLTVLEADRVRRGAWITVDGVPRAVMAISRDARPFDAH